MMLAYWKVNFLRKSSLPENLSLKSSLLKNFFQKINYDLKINNSSEKLSFSVNEILKTISFPGKLSFPRKLSVEAHFLENGFPSWKSSFPGMLFL